MLGPEPGPFLLDVLCILGGTQCHTHHDATGLDVGLVRLGTLFRDQRADQGDDQGTGGGTCIEPGEAGRDRTREVDAESGNRQRPRHGTYAGDGTEGNSIGVG